MKTCPNPKCKRPLPDSAEHCPYCGQSLATKNTRHTLIYVAGIALLAIAVILLARPKPVESTPKSMPESVKSTEAVEAIYEQPTATQRTIARTPTPALAASPTVAEITSKNCLGAPSPRLYANALVKVVTSNQNRLVLRSKPLISDSTELQRLDWGTELKIHDGPVCVSDPETDVKYWFWEVKVKSSGRMGWVAEGDRWLYYLKMVH